MILDKIKKSILPPHDYYIYHCFKNVNKNIKNIILFQKNSDFLLFPYSVSKGTVTAVMSRHC